MLKTIATTAAALGGLLLAPAVLAEHERDYDANDRYAERNDTRGYGGDYAYGEVVDVDPIVRHVTVRRPVRECWDEEVYHDAGYRGNGYRDDGYRHNDSAGAVIAGGLIGGVIGRQFGGGKGRDAMTVVGTLVGSAMAHDRSARRQHHAPRADYRYQPARQIVQRCDTRHETHQERRIDGYRVTYVYAGREYTTRTATDPGSRIRVRVAVTPVISRSY